MRATNLPSLRSPVVWTRGTPPWRITVNAGACAAVRETVAAPSRARNARPDFTSEAVVESQREPQGFPGGHRLRHVHAQPAPIDAEAQVGEPAAECGEPIGGQARRPRATPVPRRRVPPGPGPGAKTATSRLRPRGSRSHTTSAGTGGRGTRPGRGSHGRTPPPGSHGTRGR